jgi:hypothetical protein
VLRLRLLVTLMAAGFLPGCLASATVIDVNADGTGTIESLTTMSPSAFVQLRQFASGLSGEAIGPVRAREMGIRRRQDGRWRDADIGRPASHSGR